MADHDIPAYPYMFSQDQWTNKYSPYKNKGIPWPASYVGTPTDAHGNPIQSYLDTQAQHDAWQAAQPKTAAPVTLNSNPLTAGLEPKGSQARAMQDAGYGDWALLDPMMAASRQGQMGGEGSVAATTGWNPANPASKTGTLPAGGVAGGNTAGGGASGAAGGTAQTNPYDMNQAYLTALSNPGHVNTPGATVPQSAPPSNQSGVLQQFLANWDKNGGQSQGAGNYNNSGFINALRGMV